MSAARRFFVQAAIILVLVALVVGVWWWKDGQRQRQLDEQAALHAGEVADLRTKAEFWAEALAAGEAEAVFSAFTAGVAPSVLANRVDSVEIAAGALLELHGIEFVHVVRPDGTVIYTSDRKLTTAGTAGERLAWALSTTELTSRDSDVRGVTELAAPLANPDGPVAYIWIGYRTEQVAQELRPEVF